ncbi:hypothetical protein N7466_009474 [Penicillium verhagenii]|uniref:uncharacterized protein n=1 Tax=Penicillium verhagenii TaxID=1562060 RepID=UPI00254593C1|nr:uncharacterized protein N7466_009474 [Penicillium verhagenii]KAJ5921148.1 hypothetical protein N7466_009474 [Penicillium verhagenii]
MGKVTYKDGVAILQLVVFPFILVASIFIWKRTGWRIGAKIWRYPFTLSLIRLAGSIASLISIDNNGKNVEIAVFVCELIGIAPLLLAYVGMLRLIDLEKHFPPRPLAVVTLMGIIGLVLGIVGVSKAKSLTPSTLTKVAMGLFLAVFVITMLLTVWLFQSYSVGMLSYQKKLFLAIALSAPFLLVRLIYSALGDYTTSEHFLTKSLVANDETSVTVYLCMSVLEEIVCMVIAMVFGVLAVLSSDFVKPNPDGEVEVRQKQQSYGV